MYLNGLDQTDLTVELLMLIQVPPVLRSEVHLEEKKRLEVEEKVGLIHGNNT